MPRAQLLPGHKVPRMVFPERSIGIDVLMLEISLCLLSADCYMCCSEIERVSGSFLVELNLLHLCHRFMRRRLESLLPGSFQQTGAWCRSVAGVQRSWFGTGNTNICKAALAANFAGLGCNLLERTLIKWLRPLESPIPATFDSCTVAAYT